MTTMESEPKTEGALDLAQAGERKPPLTRTNIMVMTLGFFGNSFGFGIVFSAVNPLFLLIGAKPDELPILNIAGPITGLVIQPLIGAISDKTWSDRWGRRKPFITGGAFLCAILLLPSSRSSGCSGLARDLPVAARRRQQHLDRALPGVPLRAAARSPSWPAAS